MSRQLESYCRLEGTARHLGSGPFRSHVMNGAPLGSHSRRELVGESLGTALK